jgi:hypothetical protein
MLGCWVWARLLGHMVPSPGLAGCYRGFHPQLAEDRALWVSRLFLGCLGSSPKWKKATGEKMPPKVEEKQQQFEP